MKRVTINGSGEQTRSFVHIERVVDFIEQLVISNKTSELYNLVDQNLTVNDVAYTLKDIIPDMEMLYVDRPLKLREIKVSEDPHVIEFIGNKNKTLQEELEEFLEKMA